MSDPQKPFFVGYLACPPQLRLFLAACIFAVIGGFSVGGLLAGVTQDDPGTGAFRGDYGRQTLKGVVELTPYPLIHVTEGTQRVPAGHTLMLTAAGKSGVMGRAMPHEGKVVQVSGTILQRGDLDMLQLRGGRNGLRAAEGAGSAPAPEPLGRWKLAGEICDGKCLAGAMRPGRGLAHKACANLCLIGAVPPVFVSSQPVDGEEFLLIRGPEGTYFPETAYDFVAQYVSLEGDVSRHGDLLVLTLDPGTVEVLR